MPAFVCPECNARFTAEVPAGTRTTKCLRCHAMVPVTVDNPKPGRPASPARVAPAIPGPEGTRPAETTVPQTARAHPASTTPQLRREVREDDPPAGPRSGGNLLFMGLAGVVVVVGIAAAGIGWLAWSREEPPTAQVTRMEAEPVQPERAATLSGEQMYPQLLRSSAFILTAENFLGHNYMSVGSGFLVHRDRRLLVTNHHVVGDHPVVLAFFPKHDKNRELITDPKQYAQHVGEPGIRARVVVKDSRVDLAVLELERVPDGIQALPLASTPAPIGSSVYSIGSSGVNPLDLSGSLWRLSTGTVRGRSRQQLKFWNGSTIDAMVLETQKPVNPGDSGGPTVNDRCELVSVVMGSRTGEDLVKFDVDVVEVHDVLTRYAQSAGWAWRGARPTAQPLPPPPAAPPSSEDRLKEYVARLKSPDPQVRAEAVRGLAQMQGDARPAIPDILSAMRGIGSNEQADFEKALSQIGPPEKSDQAVLLQAIQSDNPAARRYALGLYSKSVTAPREAVPALVGLLGDQSAGVRAEAIQALKQVGPSSRLEAYQALVDRLGDEDATTAATAKDLLDLFADPTSNELELLRTKLTHPRPEVRRYAARILIERAQGPRDALTLAKALLRDSDVTIREAVLASLSKWRSEIREAVPDLLTLFEDAHPSVRAKAVGLAAGFGREPGMLDSLVRVAGKDSAAEVRDAAHSAIAGLELNRPTDLPALRVLLRHKSAEYQSKAAGRIAELGAEGADATDDLVDALSRGTEASRAEVIRALSAIGPKAATRSVEPLGRLLIRKDAGETTGYKDRVAAAAALAKVGEPGLPPLMAALREKGLPGPVTAEVCRAVGSLGGKADPAVADLLRVAEQADQRSAVGDVLAAIGGDAVINGLIKKTELVFVTQNRKRVDVVPADLRLWAIETLGNLDAKRLTDKQFGVVTDRLDFVASRERDPANKAAATRALNRLKSVTR